MEMVILSHKRINCFTMVFNISVNNKNVAESIIRVIDESAPLTC